jgi:hypothetical protein
MSGQARLFAVVALAVAFASFPVAGTLAQQKEGPVPPPAPGKGGNVHPDAVRANQANPRAVHAGPGAPMRGSVHVAPAQAKRDARK